VRAAATAVVQVLLVIVLIAMLIAQVDTLPYYAYTSALQYPAIAWLQIPFLVIAIAIVACGEVVIVATLVLLTLVRRDRIFHPRAFRFVDAIIGAILLAAALCLLLGVWLQLAAGDSNPASTGLYLATAFIVGFALLIGVLRGLLRQATRLDAELAEVI